VRQMVKGRTNVYTLGDRVQTLASPEPGIIIPTGLDEGQERWPFEVIFKSTLRLLLDNAGGEYVFDIDFFICPRLTQSRLEGMLLVLLRLCPGRTALIRKHKHTNKHSRQKSLGICRNTGCHPQVLAEFV
jgi:hypothetical protein